MVSPSEKKVLMRQEAESKLLAQANARDPDVKLVKIRSGKGKANMALLSPGGGGGGLPYKNDGVLVGHFEKNL